MIEFAKMYPLEFDEYGDLSFLTSSLNNFIVDVRNDDDFANLKGVNPLAQKMVEKKKDIAFPKVYLLVKLALILSVATANIEIVFSAMNFIKDKLCN